MKLTSLLTSLLAGVLLLSACEDNGDFVFPKSSAQYVFLAHTRDTVVKNTLIEGVDQANYNAFDMLWLGGDLLGNSTINANKMQELEKVFSLSDPNTLFAPGNHDYINPELIEPVTNRPTFYTHHKNNITFLVWDTMLDSNRITDEQLGLFKSVTDTLQKSTHLILLHHHCIWLIDGGTLQSQISQISNATTGRCFECLIKPNNFYSELYPVLKEVRERGIEVICLAGDGGRRLPYYELVTPDSIYFVLSGMSDAGAKQGEVLVFDHDVIEGKLTWKKELVSNLPR